MLEPAQAIVGRAAELGALDDALGSLEAERRLHAVELSGEPGMGKTRLLRGRTSTVARNKSI